MDYKNLKANFEKPSLKILKKEDPSFIISFLYKEFKVQGRNIVSENNLEENLKFFRLGLAEHGFEQNDFDASKILNDWANQGFLRKMAPLGKSEIEFELTVEIEKVFQFLEDLNKKEFIGTESRLLKIFEILKEISFQSSSNPEQRIFELEKRKSEIESEISELKSGKLKKFSETQFKERYMDLFDTARKLLSDFREVEFNFREIDSEIRKKSLETNSNRGKFLKDVLEKESFLYDSDQGKSFNAFFELLISEKRKEELDFLIENLLSVPELKEDNFSETEINKSKFFRRLKSNMQMEANKVQKTNSKIAEGLKKFLVEKNFQENKRITDLIGEIKKLSLNRTYLTEDKKFLVEIDDKPEISLIMERPIFTPSEELELNEDEILIGDDSNYSEKDLSSLFKRFYINKEEFRNNIRELFKKKSQVSLKEIFEIFPSEKGLLDVLGYFSLTREEENLSSTIEDETTEELMIQNIESSKFYKIKVPRLVFHRES